MRRRYGGDAVPASLLIRADSAILRALGAGEHGEAWDCTRVEIRLVDQYGNISPFATECVDVSIEGPGRLLGPSRLPLVGGCLAFWVRTTGEVGKITVKATGTRFEAEGITIEAE